MTTAHQPVLLTGPLYFIYKICSAIHLADRLNAQHHDSHVHPVFVIGGEDHDFAECNHLNLFGKTFTWETAQTGAVGRMHTDDLMPVLESIREVFGSSPYADALNGVIDEAFQPEWTYGQAMQKFVIRLFAHTPLIVLQMDDPAFKQAFTPVMRAELFDTVSHALISATQAELEEAGYKPQAYLRDINLFYLHDRMRSRIERSEDGLFRIVDSEQVFTPDAMERELTDHPGRFSPNVNLRPVYQETILPNLAYIGGGGEIAYWLERKSQFAHFHVPFPMLIRRNSVLYVNRGMQKLRNELDITVPALFHHPHELISSWVQAHAEHEIDIGEETHALDVAFDAIRDKAMALDPTLANKIEAFKTKTLKGVDDLGKRLVRAEKAQHERTIQKIGKLCDRLFPEQGLQERHDNFMQYYLGQGPDWINRLIETLDPLEPGFIVMEEK